MALEGVSRGRRQERGGCPDPEPRALSPELGKDVFLEREERKTGALREGGREERASDRQEGPLGMRAQRRACWAGS